MDDSQDAASDFQKFRGSRRKVIRMSQEMLIGASYLDPERKFPLVMQPEVEQVNLVTWAQHNREVIETQLLKHGAILFRNFDFDEDGVTKFEQFARAFSPELLDYRERAAPRRTVGNNIYTSTEYPADQRIPLHHEMSYSHNWPMKIWFYCAQPAAGGGATPITDDRVVFERLDPRLKEPFMRKRVMYTRNFGENLDLPWQDVFQTTDKATVEMYCRQANTEFEWKDGNRLRTRQVRQAVVTHPRTGATVWFNHAHMFHLSNLEPATRAALLAEFTEENLPRNAYYGDGTPIEDSVLDEIRAVYDESAIVFDWQKDDVLMLDNILASHGREPFTPPRRILVAMAELFINDPLQFANPWTLH
jgi:alpha-ketoglutarate-dependent taurine dioxygenase